MSHWQISPVKSLVLDRPRLLAILNVTPDSFSDGGSLLDPKAVVDAAARAVRDGADMLDVGGESTRPGAQRIPAEEQIARVVPALHAIRAAGGALAEVPISVDTTLAGVARAALDAGADAINDVSGGLDDPGMLPLASSRQVGIVLMHRLRAPERDSYSDRYERPPEYGDVVRAVREFLGERADAAMRAGVSRERIVLDPGLGFGKSVEQNLELVRRTGEFLDLGFPILSGASRKSFVGRVAAGGAEPAAPKDRVAGSVAISVTHLLAGARLFRVHDVRAHLEALDVAWPMAATRL